MLRVFRYLVMLAGEKFWGEVTICFKDGQVVGQIQVNRAYLLSTLPEPVDESPPPPWVTAFASEYPPEPEIPYDRRRPYDRRGDGGRDGVNPHR